MALWGEAAFFLSLTPRGLHLLDSTHIRERLGHIAPELKSYDIVGLQEVRYLLAVNAAEPVF